MSNILKGILNESNPFYGHNDPAREYGADDPPRFNKSRSSYRSQEDDDEYDPYGLIRQEKDFAKGRAMKAAAEKAQRDSDHDRLATGTNEGLDDPWGDQGNFAGDKPVNLGNVSMKNIQTGDTVKYLGQSSQVVAMSKDRKYSRIKISKGMGTVTQDVLTSDLQQLGRGTAIEEDNNTRMRMNDYYDLADAIQEKLRNAIRMGNKELIQKLNKERDELDARVKQYGLMPESQLDELDTKLGLYKIAAGKDATAADKAGDYTRGHKRFKGIMKATEKEFANDAKKKKDADEKKSAISQGINEFSPGATGPKGPKDYGQPNSSRYIGGNKFVVGTTNNYVLTATIDKWGLEWDEDDEIWFLDSPGAAHIADASEGEIELPPPREQRNQIHDLVTDYLNARNSADLQKVAAYYGHSNDGEMATNEGIEAPRFNSKQEVINHFVKNGKSAAAGAAAWERGYRGSSNKPIELKKPPQRSYHDELDDKRYSSIDENLGDQLKSTSFEELVKAKLAIARQIEAEAEAFERDLYKNNTVQKAQQGLRREFEPTPVAQPGEKHSVLKDRLKYLDIAKQKFEEVNRLINAIRKNYRHYEVANKMDKLDKSLLPYVEVGPKDNYKSLFVKLSKIETELSELYPTAAAAVAKKNNQGVAEGWSQKYKSSINCSHPKGFSQKAHCAGKKKHNESIDNIMEMTCPDCGMCETHVGHTNLDEACWKGYHKEGMKTMFGKEYPDCRKNKKKNKTNKEGLVEGPALSTSTLTGEIPRLMGIRKKEQRDLIEKYALHNREKDYFELFVELSGKPMPEIYNMNDSHQLAYELYNLGSQIASDWRNISNPAFSRREYLNQIMNDWYNLFKKSIQKYKSMKQGLAEEQLNELDFFAPVTTFIKMTDGSYIQADWRKSQGNPGLSDSASFVNFKPVNPNVAKQLGLDNYQRNKSISNYRDGTMVPGGPIQGSGPLANRGYEVVDYNKPETMEELPPEIKSELIKWVQKQNVVEESCPHCNGPMFSEMIMNEKKDACYYKVKSRYKVWPSAYASGALVKCRNKGASNWGNGGKKNESSILEGINRADESLHDWFNKEKWVRMDTKGKIKGPCAREPGEGKPKCLPQSKAHSLGKKGRASAAQRKRREDPNPERSGKAINVDTKKNKG